MQSSSIEVIAAPAAAIVALDPVRARLLAALREPQSASALARAQGLPRQRVNYHLKQLEAQGLVTAADERKWGGLTERLVVASAGAYVVSPEALGPAAPDAANAPDSVHAPQRDDRLSASYLVAVAARAIREVGSLLRRSLAGGRRVETFTLDTVVVLANPQDRADFARDLAAAVTTVVARYHNEQAPQGRAHRLVVGAYPIPKNEEHPHGRRPQLAR